MVLSKAEEQVDKWGFCFADNNDVNDGDYQMGRHGFAKTPPRGNGKSRRKCPQGAMSRLALKITR
jgi:hypothetical protein